jgi:hypothetical protein
MSSGLVVIVNSIKCLYIYFLRNSSNSPSPFLFENKFYWQRILHQQGDGTAKNSVLRKLFIEKISSLKNNGFTATEMTAEQAGAAPTIGTLHRLIN